MRNNGINAEIYPEPAKMKKQMSYADNNRIPFVAIVGETEMENHQVMLKNMSLLTDLKILIFTIEIIFKGKGV